MLGHGLDLVDIAGTLVITIDFIAFVWVSLGIASHEIRVLHAAHGLAGSILAGDQVDSLGLPPLVLLCNNIFDIADIYCHMFLLPCDAITEYAI